MATTQSSTDALEKFLVWARANGFRVSEIEASGMRVKVDDLRSEVATEPKGKRPRNVHEAFAIEKGIPIPPDPAPDDEDDGLEDGA
jgi:hypothetical protein